jgi:hypothetical protein
LIDNILRIVTNGHISPVPETCPGLDKAGCGEGTKLIQAMPKQTPTTPPNAATSAAGALPGTGRLIADLQEVFPSYISLHRELDGLTDAQQAQVLRHVMTFLAGDLEATRMRKCFRQAIDRIRG